MCRCAQAHRHSVTAPTPVYCSQRYNIGKNIADSPPYKEDITHATYQNTSPYICHCRCYRDSHPCCTALGTGGRAGIYWRRAAGGRCACAGCGRSSAARGRVPRARGRGPASGGVWLCAGCGRGILRPLLSAMETSPLPLAPLVMIPSLDDALPCRVDREGLFYLHSTTAPIPASPCKTREVTAMHIVRRA